MATILPVESLLLQGDVNASGYTIHNLNKSGLLLVKADVGLGNVNNTSDDNKPVSQAMFMALAAKEASVPYGSTSQFWRGDKTWQTLGALAFESGTTGLATISTIALTATATAILKVNRHDVSAAVSIRHTGESALGTVLPGVALANAGSLAFDGCSVAVIKTNNAAPIIFGVNNARRMRLETGLNVGGDTDPGAGCITAFGAIIGGTLSSAGTITAVSSITGDTVTVTTLLTATAASIGSGGMTCAGNFVGSGNLSATGTTVKFIGLPTSDPHVAGVMWRSTNDVKISTG